MSVIPKTIPSSIGIFGASGHIGGPMARWLRYHAPQVALRLISSRPDKADRLRADFPDCAVALGDYGDLPSLTDAVAGLEGLFVVTTTRTREDVAMGNLVAALRRSGTLVQMIRLVGVFPDANPRRIPEAIRSYGLGLEVQHQIARRLLDEAELPVTYLNIGASFIDNLLRQTRLVPGRRIVWPERRVPFIDPRDIAEAAARILLSDNPRHIHQFHTINNGSDRLTMAEVVATLSDVLQCRIDYDPSRESFFSAMAPAVKAGAMPADFPDYLWNFFRYEDDNDVAWVLNDFLERTLGRKPVTVRNWIQEHRTILLQNLDGGSAAS